MAESTIDLLSSEVAQALAPISDALSSPAGVKSLLNELGWQLPPAVEDIGLVGLSADDVIAKLEAIQKSTPEEEQDDDVMLGRYAALLTSIGQLVAKIVAKAATLGQGVVIPADYLQATQIDKQFATRLLDYLITVYVEQSSPAIHAFLTALGIFEQKYWDADPTLYRTEHFRRAIVFDRIGKLLTDPGAVAAELYGWGTPTPNPNALVTNLGLCIEALGGLVALRQLPRKVEEALVGRQVPEAAAEPMPQLLISIIKGLGWDPLDIGVSVYGIRPSAAGATDGGIGLSPFVTGTAELLFPLSNDGRWKLEIETQFAVDGGIAVLLQPNKPIAVKSGLLGDTAGQVAASGRMSVALAYGSGGDERTNVLTIYGATHLEIGEFRATFQFALDGDEPEFGFLIELSKAAFILSAGDGDGFLQKVLPGEGMAIDFDLAIGWSNKKGIYFRGSAGVEVTLPLHLDLFGVLQIESIYLRIQTRTLPNTTGLELIVATSAGLTLGPIAASVDRMGVSALLAFPTAGGGFGPENLTIGFRPPRGVGFVLDASAVVGGGFLFFDYDASQYGGILQLEVKGGISIKAIALITTRMPDGSSGFSLLIIIAVEFSPIQLGYGFTLNGVGGLAGFNRTMKVDPLRDGIKNRTLDSIMFPPDPIKNAQKIISDLQAIFPPAPDRFVFAPMVKFGWGSGILLIEIGLIVELPMPLRLAIIGKLHLKLPPIEAGEGEESKNLVELHLDVLGILDFDRNEASVDAVLYNSRLVIFPITGGMAMRLRWGRDPIFLMAIGGLNPRFPPPPAFPTVDRLGMNLSYDNSGVKACLRLESYLAVTPNSLQFGARIDAYAELSVAKIAFFIGFDALIEFNPFHFIVDLYGGVTVQAFGFSFSVDLLLTFSGPGPFLGEGHVSVEFLGKHEIPIRFVIGEEDTTPALPPVDPLPELMAAFADLRNWSAAMAVGSSMVLTMRQLPPQEAAGKVLAHPLAELSVRQKVLPFGIALERFGAAVPTTPGPFEIAQVQIGTRAPAPPVAANALRDAFARGQFVNLTEDEKVSAPGFEPFRCGQTSIGTDAIVFPAAAKQSADADYDATVIDNKEDRGSGRTDTSATFSDVAFLRAAEFGAARQTPMAATGSAKFAGTPKGIKVHPPAYRVADTGTLDPAAAGYETYTEADAARRAGGAEVWQVVEEYEVA
jgi:uncharacterized protein DUF6603